MATSSVILDIRANTQRALSEFKTFSSQLDNKFLVSGLKLDVVRSALSQINREFQRSMGEQGLVSSQSLKAAENQATLLTNIYTGFSKTASARITEDFSKALSEVAVRTGGTVSDIQKSLSISPFLSRSFSRQDRGAILGDLQRIQTFASQAGLGNNAGDIFKKIATGQTNFMELESSDDSLSKVIGARLRETAPVSDLSAVSIEERTRILKNLAKSLDVKELEELAKETGGFRVVLAKFSASLFNPKVGLFGAMKEFTLSTGEAPTTIFKETTRLFESIFGEQGFIKTLGRELAKAFGIRGEDAAVKFLGRGIRFITNLIKSVTDLIDDVINNPIVKGIVEIVKSAFDGIVKFISRLDEIAKNPPQFPDISKESIQTFIKEIGENVRGFLKKVGAFIRGEDISDEAESGASIIGTIVDEAGKTMLTFFKEVGDALLAKAGTVALELAKVLPGTIANLFTKALSGEGGLIGRIIAGLAVGGGLLGLSRGIGATRQVFAGSGGLGGAFNRAIGSPVGSWSKLEDRLEARRQARAGRMGGGGGGSNVPPGLDDLISSVRNQPDRYSLDPMFENIRKNNEIDKFNREFAQSQKQFKDREFFQRQFVKGQYGSSLGGFQMEGPMQIGKYGSQYNTPIGPLPHGSAEPWTMANGRYQPYMGNVNEEAMLESRRREIARRQALGRRNPFMDTFRGALDTSPYDALPADQFWGADRSNRNVAARFNRRYGSGGTRAIMGRGIRGLGKGALIAGGIAGAIALLSGGNAQASEIDPMTGEPIQSKVGAGEAFGKVGMGAAEGALTGAMFGPWGAAIGGVIGGGVALMDKGVRDTVVKSIANFGSNILKNLTEAATGFKNAVFSGLDVVKKWASNIDWKNILLDIVFPGRGLIRTGLESLGVKKDENKDRGFLGNAKNFFLDLFGVKEDEPRREVGGPVSRGITYRVNERGTELFTPSQDGSIMTNRDLNKLLASRSRGGETPSNVTFNVTINATGLAGNDIATAIKPAVIKILDDGMKQVSSSTITRGTTVI